MAPNANADDPVEEPNAGGAALAEEPPKANGLTTDVVGAAVTGEPKKLFAGVVAPNAGAAGFAAGAPNGEAVAVPKAGVVVEPNADGAAPKVGVAEDAAALPNEGVAVSPNAGGWAVFDPNGPDELLPKADVVELAPNEGAANEAPNAGGATVVDVPNVGDVAEAPNAGCAADPNEGAALLPEAPKVSATLLEPKAGGEAVVVTAVVGAPKNELVVAGVDEELPKTAGAAAVVVVEPKTGVAAPPNENPPNLGAVVGAAAVDAALLNDPKLSAGVEVVGAPNDGWAGADVVEAPKALVDPNDGGADCCEDAPKVGFD